MVVLDLHSFQIDKLVSFKSIFCRHCYFKGRNLWMKKYLWIFEVFTLFTKVHSPPNLFISPNLQNCFKNSQNHSFPNIYLEYTFQDFYFKIMCCFKFLISNALISWSDFALQSIRLQKYKPENISENAHLKKLVLSKYKNFTNGFIYKTLSLCLAQPCILRRLIKWIPWTPGDLVIKMLVLS